MEKTDKKQVKRLRCPAWLMSNEIAYKEWRRIVPELLRSGIITKLDHSIIAMYCVTYSNWIKAEADLSELKISENKQLHRIVQSYSAQLKSIIKEIRLLTSSGRLRWPSDDDFRDIRSIDDL